ncbi:MAG: type II secretion system F family protein [Clostridia bacterium]|nr:type II secretion system F family protein [Clostridia bacterium]
MTDGNGRNIRDGGQSDRGAAGMIRVKRRMKASELLAGIFAGGACGFAAFSIMFGSIALSLAAAAVCAAAGVRIYGKILEKKRRDTLKLEFRDVLESLGNSVSSGKNSYEAFYDACRDLKASRGSGSDMVRELERLTNGLENGSTLEEMLAGMAQRTGDPDIACFSETFAACGRAGGNMKQIICISRDIITDRISVGMEISASVASGKNEMYVMSVLPFAVVAMMKTLGNEALTGNSLLNVGVKIAALCLFAAAFAVGKKITDITV